MYVKEKNIYNVVYESNFNINYLCFDFESV